MLVSIIDEYFSISMKIKSNFGSKVLLKIELIVLVLVYDLHVLFTWQPH